jgi:hypothetical protein
MYTVDYFIEKFSAIPEEKWGKHTIDPDYFGKCCVLGHVGTTRLDDLGGYKLTEEGKALVRIISGCGVGQEDFFTNSVTNINDFNRDSKQAMLKALHDIKKQKCLIIQ